MKWERLDELGLSPLLGKEGPLANGKLVVGWTELETTGFSRVVFQF